MTLRERIAAVQQLKQQFGDAESIPEEALAAIDYERVVDPDQATVNLVPAERLGDLAASQTMRHEQSTRMPFDKLSADIAVNETSRVGFINEKITAELGVLGDNPTKFKWLSPRDPSRSFATSDITESAVVSFFGGERAQLESLNIGWGISEYLTHILPLEMNLPEIGDHELWLDNSLDAYGPDQIAQIRDALQGLKAKLTDVAQIEQFCNDDFMNLRWFDGPAATIEADRPADIEFAGPTDVDLTSLPPSEKMALQLARFKNTLRAEGLADVAEGLYGVSTLAEIRDVLAASPYAEEALVRQMYDYFDSPNRYAQVAGERIEALLNMLSPEAGSDETIHLELVADPGAVKQYGNTARFFVEMECNDDRLGEGYQLGNIALVQTKTSDGRPVWHVQAVDVPVDVNHIDWNRFPRSLVSMLASPAMQAGVHCITVNARPEQISRQPHIGEAFSRYASEKMLRKQYDKMHGFIESDLVDVRLDDRMLDDLGAPRPDGQVVIWRQASTRER